jgi:hypothetical protein
MKNPPDTAFIQGQPVRCHQSRNLPGGPREVFRARRNSSTNFLSDSLYGSMVFCYLRLARSSDYYLSFEDECIATFFDVGNCLATAINIRQETYIILLVPNLTNQKFWYEGL